MTNPENSDAVRQLRRIVDPHRQAIHAAGIAGPVAAVLSVVEAGRHARPALLHRAADMLDAALKAPNLQSNTFAQALGSGVAAVARNCARERS